MTTSIVIVGVGGQGTLLASRIIGGAAIQSGLDVKVSEVHGMSQRGGSVITYVRFGDTAVHSPLIDEGGADVVMAFELLEAYRSIPYVKKPAGTSRGGRMIINTQSIDPMPVITGAAAFPSDIAGKIQQLGIDTDILDALALANEAGSGRAVNVVLIGRLARVLPFPVETWREVLRAAVKPSFLDINMKAFELGYNAVQVY